MFEEDFKPSNVSVCLHQTQPNIVEVDIKYTLEMAKLLAVKIDSKIHENSRPTHVHKKYFPTPAFCQVVNVQSVNGVTQKLNKKFNYVSLTR